MALLGTAEDQSQLMLAAGLLGGGNFGQALSRGLLGSQQVLDGAEDRSTKKAMVAAQMANYQSEISARDQATTKAKKLAEFIAGLSGGGVPGVPGTGMPGQNITSDGGTAANPGHGITNSGGTAQMPGGGISNNSLLGLDVNKIAQLKMMGGPDMLEAYKYANDPQQLQAGSTYQNRMTGARETMPLLDKGQQFSGGQISNIPGAVNAQAEAAGATARATEAAKAAQDPMQVYSQAAGGMVYQPRSAVAASGGTAPDQAALIKNLGQGQLSPGLQALIQRDAQANGIQNPQANFTGAGARGRYDLAGGGSAPAAAPATGPYMAAPPSSAVLGDKAGSNLNDSWIKNSYEPVIASQKTASATIDTVKVSRDALSKMGSSGWGTETKAQAAGILAGLGVAPEAAKLYASNAQVFNNTAMARLDTSLKAAVGPQTEGDAARASKLYASLGNTPQANKFTLDLIEAQANRDQVKARFYQAATPIARSKGDLTEVDRAWEQRAPSVFDMPSMKAWGIK